MGPVVRTTIEWCRRQSILIDLLSVQVKTFPCYDVMVLKLNRSDFDLLPWLISNNGEKREKDNKNSLWMLTKQSEEAMLLKIIYFMVIYVKNMVS